MKTCSRCGTEKLLADFHRVSKNRPGKLRAQCRTCTADQHREWRRNNPDRMRQRWREASRRHWTKKQYGLDQAAVDRLVLLQGGGCAICGARDRRFCVDHDHATGVVRGVLCSQCNSAIELLGDNAALVACALEYLTQRGGTVTSVVSYATDTSSILVAGTACIAVE